MGLKEEEEGIPLRANRNGPQLRRSPNYTGLKEAHTSRIPPPISSPPAAAAAAAAAHGFSGSSTRPPYRSPPRRGYGGRGRSPPRRGYGGRREQGSGSLLVRNIPLSCRGEDLRVPFERFGPVRDVYLPKDYYSGEPRGFAFVEFVDPYDASEAQYHMNRQVFFGREITVVLAAESRKRPEEMRSRARVREVSFPFSLSPLSRSYSPAPRRRDDYSASPPRKDTHPTKSPRRQPKEHDEEKKRRSYSPASRDGDPRDADNGYEKRSPPPDSDGSPPHRRSPRHSSGSPPGSRSRSADVSPARSD
uniref:RRM domain-containing protein n=1 Tax=Oryza nivara TaxID=4536 RepID=A0A0E0G818_ORYNI